MQMLLMSKHNTMIKIKLKWELITTEIVNYSFDSNHYLTISLFSGIETDCLLAACFMTTVRKLGAASEA